MAIITPNSEVRLIKNVPFSNSYRNVILFNSRQEQENYFKSLPSLVKEDFKYQRANGLLTYPASKDEVLQYNYLMYKNNVYENRYFYAFITNVSYVNPNTCNISFEIDVFQTWMLDVSFQPTYIERQHCKRWNADGSPVINTIPEKLNYGAEYVIKGYERSFDKGGINRLSWLVFVTTLDDNDFTDKGADLLTKYLNGSIGDSVLYITVPFLITDINKVLNVVTNSEITDQTISSTRPDLLLWEFRNDTNLVKKLVACYVTDYVPFEYNYDGNAIVNITDGNVSNFNVKSENKGKICLPFYYSLSTTMYSYKTLTFPKYTGQTRNISESKLLMYPYTFNVLTDLQGNEFTIKNEYVDGNNINIKVRPSIGSTGNKISYTVTNYLDDTAFSVGELYLGNGIINAEPNRVTTVDDYTSAFIQGNMNTIVNGINQTKQNTQLNNQIAQNNAITRVRTQGIQDMSQVAQAGINGLASLGSGGYVPMAMSNLLNSGVNAITNQLALSVENANNMGNMQMRGELNNQQAVNSAMAKYEDARNTADNAILQGGNALFNYGYQNIGCKMVHKQITREYIDLLTDYFQKYGYAYHRVEVPNLKSRRSFNYIQTVGANIVGNIPQIFIDALQNLFNSGVTIWHTTDVGNYNLNNDEV